MDDSQVASHEFRGINQMVSGRISARVIDREGSVEKHNAFLVHVYNVLPQGASSVINFSQLSKSSLLFRVLCKMHESYKMCESYKPRPFLTR